MSIRCSPCVCCMRFDSSNSDIASATKFPWTWAAIIFQHYAIGTVGVKKDFVTLTDTINFEQWRVDVYPEF